MKERDEASMALFQLAVSMNELAKLVKSNNAEVTDDMYSKISDAVDDLITDLSGIIEERSEKIIEILVDCEQENPSP